MQFNKILPSNGMKCRYRPNMESVTMQYHLPMFRSRLLKETVLADADKKLVKMVEHGNLRVII